LLFVIIGEPLVFCELNHRTFCILRDVEDYIRKTTLMSDPVATPGMMSDFAKSVRERQALIHYIFTTSNLALIEYVARETQDIESDMLFDLADEIIAMPLRRVKARVK
jgi:hypothetical protein